MSYMVQIEALRLSLTMLQEQARIASTNISQHGMPGATKLSADFAGVANAIGAFIGRDSDIDQHRNLAKIEREIYGKAVTVSTDPVNLDSEVADMVMASTKYQAVADALGRKFALMRLAITGRN